MNFRSTNRLNRHKIMAWETKTVEEFDKAQEAQAAAGSEQNQNQEQNQQQQQNQNQEAGKKENQQQQEPAKFNDEDVVKVLTDRGITVSKIDDIKSAFDTNKSYAERLEQLQKENEVLAKKEIEFKSDKQKALFEFASKHEGFELAAAKNLLNVVGLDLDKADPKQLQFEAFVLQYPNYPREEAKAIFDADYTDKFGEGTDFASNPLLKFKHDQATNAARQSIASAVKNYMEAKSPEPTPTSTGPTPEQVKQMEEAKRGIEGSLKDFKGSTINLPEYTTKEGLKVPAGALNMEIKPEEAAKFKGYLENPESFLRDVIGKFKSEKGMDWNGYTNAMHQLFAREESYAKIHSQGIEKGMLIMLEKINNSGGNNKDRQEANDQPAGNKRWERKPVEV